jgi:hypothetical protein
MLSSFRRSVVRGRMIATLTELGERVLRTADCNEKSALTLQAAKLWCDGAVPVIGAPVRIDQPARPTNVKAVHPKLVPRR